MVWLLALFGVVSAKQDAPASAVCGGDDVPKSIDHERIASTEERIERLHAGGLVDMHFDLPLGLQWNGATRM